MNEKWATENRSKLNSKYEDKRGRRINVMWKYKTTCRGELTTAVKRRIEKYGEIDLTDKTERSRFGTCYLEYE
tara:strand:- start:1745 stop:1963 length:219 start_codon:yes stop_codon:yes gene_type:complete